MKEPNKKRDEGKKRRKEEKKRNARRKIKIADKSPGEFAGSRSIVSRVFFRLSFSYYLTCIYYYIKYY
jgi:hypothetical protein